MTTHPLLRDGMSRTSDDLRQMAEECRRLASTCSTPEAGHALSDTASEMDAEAGQKDVADSDEERGLSENPDRGHADSGSE